MKKNEDEKMKKFKNYSAIIFLIIIVVTGFSQIKYPDETKEFIAKLFETKK